MVVVAAVEQLRHVRDIGCKQASAISQQYFTLHSAARTSCGAHRRPLGSSMGRFFGKRKEGPREKKNTRANEETTETLALLVSIP